MLRENPEPRQISVELQLRGTDTGQWKCAMEKSSTSTTVLWMLDNTIFYSCTEKHRSFSFI